VTIFDPIKNGMASISDPHQKFYRVCFQQSNLAELPPMVRIAVNLLYSQGLLFSAR